MRTSTSNRWLHRARVALFSVAMLGVPVAFAADFFVSVAIAPPPLPVYAQPICPGPGYIWIPGYWAYGPSGYYWVQGEWVLPPYVGALWTPGYWAWGDGAYLWHAGYWGTRVGFYGGINYGYGYTGYGYRGGYWRGNAFYYNVAANNINTAVIHTTYRTAVNNGTTNRVSYNGGRGGIAARPTAAQVTYARQPHTAATTAQMRREQPAVNQRSLAATSNERTANRYRANVNGERAAMNRDHAAVNHERAAVATTPQPRASGRQNGAQVQAAPFHNAPAHVERMHAAPAPRSAPAHIERMHAAPAPRSVPSRAEPRVFADAAHPQARPQLAPQAHPRGRPEAKEERGPHRG